MLAGCLRVRRVVGDLIVDRETWRLRRLESAERRFDELFAPEYDERWGQIDPAHQRMLQGLLRRLPPGARVLDAACGTGKYWPLILDGGLTVVGVDFSAQMLRRAQEKHPEVEVQRQRLQDLTTAGSYDAVICIDAMENVFPEDWPRVLNNFRRALGGAGWTYLTVELAQDSGYAADDLRSAVNEARNEGIPLVDGEVLEDGGYHFYPEPAQVRLWLSEAGFVIRDETAGDGYQHLVAELLAA
jgi:ubiquinone/menaquinone biosynthesis C-methylase UbiE